jgi:exopolysaccharide biosynthesis protein
MHRGGNLLTGVFYLKDSIPKIVLREDFESNKIENTGLVFQAGPRLIVNGASTISTDKNRRTRRSAIAVTKDHQIILLISLNRFPGASFEDVQSIFKNPMFAVTDALNLDGGGSSQFYFAGLGNRKEFLITGGDKIPIALVLQPLITSQK